MSLLYCCTSNPGKLKEFLSVMPEGFRIEPLPGLQAIPPPEENGATFEANSILKALAYSRKTAELVFADDSGLEVDALHGDPGVHSARYAGEHATGEQNNRKLLQNMTDKPDRAARFRCAITLARAGNALVTVHGRVEGRILNEPKGEHGFGYDPLFYCHAIDKSLAEATLSEKYLVSHRGHALRELTRWIARHLPPGSGQAPQNEW